MRDVQRLINQDRNHFAACMVALGDADAMVTGVTRNYSVALEESAASSIPSLATGHRAVAGAVARPHRAGGRHRNHRNADRRRTG